MKSAASPETLFNIARDIPLERANAIQRQMLDAASRRPRDHDDLLERLLDGGF